MRVLLLIHRLSWGGTQRQLVVLARGLAAAGHDVAVATFYGGGPFDDELRAAGVEVHDLQKRGRWDLARFAAHGGRVLRGIRPDVVYSFLIAPNLFALAIRPWLDGAPVVWGVRASNMDLDRYDRLSRVTFRAGCVLAHRADRIIVNSLAGLEYHRREGYPADRTVFVPNGIDTDRFRPDTVAGRAVRREWGIDDDRPTIGIVGRLDPMKDHATFLEAAALLAVRRPEPIWVVVGDGPADYSAQLRERATGLRLGDRVIWAGARSDSPAVFNAFDVATSSSAFGEGFPNVVGEALACGRPCVVTDVGDSARLVDDPRRVVPPRNPEALAAAWDASLDAPDLALTADSGRMRMVDEYSISALVRRTERELRCVVDRRAAA